MAVDGDRRVRDVGMGRLVQQPPPARAHRIHPASRSRRPLLRHDGTNRHGGVTQTKRPPANPGRFIRNYVIDPASLQVDRRARRVKTDRIDTERLLRSLMAYLRGEPNMPLANAAFTADVLMSVATTVASATPPCARAK